LHCINVHPIVVLHSSIAVPLPRHVCLPSPRRSCALGGAARAFCRICARLHVTRLSSVSIIMEQGTRRISGRWARSVRDRSGKRGGDLYSHLLRRHEQRGQTSVNSEFDSQEVWTRTLAILLDLPLRKTASLVPRSNLIVHGDAEQSPVGVQGARCKAALWNEGGNVFSGSGGTVDGGGRKEAGQIFGHVCSPDQ
jgi:hypothetical protein